jgi:ankyrin repeat protein
LVNKGADGKLTRTNGDSFDALAYTLDRTANVEVVGALLDAGADVSLLSGLGTVKIATFTQNDTEPRPLPVSCSRMRKALIDLNTEVWFGTALYYCCWWGTPGAVVELLKHKPNLEYAIKVEGYLDSGFTALRSAVYRNSTRVVRLLLDAGPNVNSVREVDGTSPLHCAVTECYDGMTGLLLEYNADIELRNKFERTPLNLIGGTTPVSVIKRLLRRGPDLEARDKMGVDTALSRRSSALICPVVEYLIDGGADLGVFVHGFRRPSAHGMSS